MRNGAVLSSGLLEVKTNGRILKLPRMKTVFGGEMWVVRALTPGEVLACWDVPEKLGQLAKTNELKGLIMREMFTPLKICQTVLEEISPVLN